MLLPVALAVILVSVVVLSRRGIPLGLGLTVGSLVLGLLSGLGPAAMVGVFLSTLVRPDVVSLALVVLGISWMGRVMSHSGAFTNLLADARSLVRNQLVLLSGFPALLSMLTIPGGAIMSAGMVGEIGDELGLQAHEKAACNVLFRHLWYFVYMVHPMYALIESISGVRLLTMFQLAIGPVALSWLVGLRTCARPGKAPAYPGNGSRLSALGRLAYASLPILVVIVARGILGMNFVVAVSLGVAAAVMYGWHGAQDRPRLADHVRARLKMRPDLWLGAAAVGVMMFQQFIGVTGVNRLLAELISEQGIPLPVTAFLVPLVLGMASGSNLAAVGMSVPLFVTVVPPALLSRYVVFIYTCSLAGYMVSPVHLCQVLSCQHFGTTQERVVRQMLPALLTLVAASAALLWL